MTFPHSCFRNLGPESTSNRAERGELRGRSFKPGSQPGLFLLLFPSDQANGCFLPPAKLDWFYWGSVIVQINSWELVAQAAGNVSAFGSLLWERGCVAPGYLPSSLMLPATWDILHILLCFIVARSSTHSRRDPDSGSWSHVSIGCCLLWPSVAAAKFCDCLIIILFFFASEVILGNTWKSELAGYKRPYGWWGVWFFFILIKPQETHHPNMKDKGILN